MTEKGRSLLIVSLNGVADYFTKEVIFIDEEASLRIIRNGDLEFLELLDQKYRVYPIFSDILKKDLVAHVLIKEGYIRDLGESVVDSILEKVKREQQEEIIKIIFEIMDLMGSVVGGLVETKGQPFGYIQGLLGYIVDRGILRNCGVFKKIEGGWERIETLPEDWISFSEDDPKIILIPLRKFDLAFVGEFVSPYKLYLLNCKFLRSLLELFILNLYSVEGFKKMYEDEISKDPLTELYNRKYFFEKFDEFIRYSKLNNFNLCLFMIDLRQFKSINDKYGHRIGDMVLKEVAKKLNSMIRKDDLIARYGGDEFLILIPNISPKDIKSVKRRLTAEMKKPLELSGKKFSFDLNIGHALFPKDGETVEELLSKADKRLLRVKKRFS